MSIRLSTEENPPGVEGFKGVDWLKEESPWPPDIQRGVYRYMHDKNLYQVTNTNDRVFVDLVNLVKSAAVVPNTRNWQQKVPEKCRALINMSTESWKQDGLLVTRNNLTRKSEVFQYLWDCAVQVARAGYSAAQSIERSFPGGELGNTTSSIDVDSMTRTGLTPEDSYSRKRSAEGMQISRPSSHTKRACGEQSDIPKDHERELMDIDWEFPRVASPARDVADETTRHTITVSTVATSHGLHHRDDSIRQRSENRFESTVLAAREALSALDPVKKGRRSLQEGIQFSQEKTHRDFSTEPHGDPAPASCSNHGNYQIKATSWSPSRSNPTSSGRPAAIVEGFNQAVSLTPIVCPNANQSSGCSMEKLPSIPHEMENNLRNSNAISQNINLSPDNAPKTSQAEKGGTSLTAQIPAQVSQTLSPQNHQPPSADSIQSNPANQFGDLDAVSEKKYSSTPSEDSGFSKCLDEVIGRPQVVTKHQNSSQSSGNGQLVFDTRSSQSTNTTEPIAQQSFPSGVTDKDRDIESTRLVPSRPPILPSAHQANGRLPGPSVISNTQSLLPDNNQIRYVPYNHFPQGPPAASPHPYQRPATPPTTKEQQVSPGPLPPYPQNHPPPSYFNQKPASLSLSSQYQSQPGPPPPPLVSSQTRGPPGSLLPPISTQNQKPSAPWLPPLAAFSPQYQSPPPRTRFQAPLPPPSTQDLGHPSLQPSSTKQQGLPPPALAQDLVHLSIQPLSTQHDPPPPAQNHEAPPSPAQGQSLPSSSAPTQYHSPYLVGSPTAAPRPLPPQSSLNTFQGPTPPSYQGLPPGLPPTQSTHPQNPSLPPPPPNSSTQCQGPQRPHQNSQHVPSLDQQQSSPYPWNSSQLVGNPPPPPPPLVTVNQQVGAPSDPSRLSSGTAFPNFRPPAGDLVWEKLNEMVMIIVPVRVQTNANMTNSGPMQRRVFPASSLLKKTVADFFQWVSGILGTTPPPALFLDFINIHSQFERRMTLYRSDPKSLEAVKTIAWEYFREIASLDPAVANVKILITPCYSAVAGSASENIHQQSQQLHRANIVSNIPSGQPSYIPLPNRNDSSIASDFADRQAICKPGGPPPIGPPPESQSRFSRTPASEAMVSHIGPSNPTPHSMLNLNGTNMSERNIPESNDKLVETCATSNQDPQRQSQQQAYRLHTPNSTKIDGDNPPTAKIVIRIQIDGLGRLSRSYDKSVLNPKITNERFFQWFEQETGGTRSSKLKFDFKDAFPAKSSIIERGKEDHFHLMVHDIKRKFNRAKAYVPDINEFCIVVTDPMWDSGDEDEDEE